MNPYLYDRIVLEHGSVDDTGEMTYVRLSQNVPDGYVTDLQADLYALGFTGVGKADGAYGNMTETAVSEFQALCGLEASGAVEATTKDELVIWLSQGRVLEASVETAAVSDGEIRMIEPRVTHFSQGDARWADRVLGRSSSIRSQGCAITCIAMILRFYGRNVNPGTLDEFLDANGGYSGNAVKWSVAAKCGAGEGPKLVFKQKTGSEKTLKKLLKQRIADNLPTMVRVDYGSDSDLTYNHFVLAVGISADGDIIINDPGTRYGDGYADGGTENQVGKTSRKNGYQLVQLDWYAPE